MKLNIANVGKRLRWSYLSAQDAEKKGIIPEKFQRLVATRQKLENIFFTAGGKPDNLRKAILKGKGNKDRAVNGLDGFDGMVEYMNEYTPMEQLLGTDIYYSENVEGMEGVQGLGDLGEPFTLASIAAASGVIAGIAAMLKQVGDIFQKKGKNSEDFDEAKNEQAEKEIVAPPVTDSPALPVPTQDVANPIIKNEAYLPPAILTPVMANQQNAVPNYNTPATKEKMQDEPLVADKVAGKGDDAKPDDDKSTGFWDKNKKWLKPVAIGVGGLGLLAIGIKLLKGSGGNNTQNKSSPNGKSLHGTPKHKPKPKKNHHRKPNSKPHKKTAVALM